MFGRPAQLSRPAQRSPPLHTGACSLSHWLPVVSCLGVGYIEEGLFSASLGYATSPLVSPSRGDPERLCLRGPRDAVSDGSPAAVLWWCLWRPCRETLALGVSLLSYKAAAAIGFRSKVTLSNRQRA